MAPQYDPDWTRPGKWWDVKTCPDTTWGLSTTDRLTFDGTGASGSISKLYKMGSTTPLGTSCVHKPARDEVTVMRTKTYTIKRKGTKLTCCPPSGSPSWTAEEGGP